jgi:hypothetical protein
MVNDPATILELLAEIDRECRIELEATYGWKWLVDALRDAGYELHLARPPRTKAIAAMRVKTDAVDAKALAHLPRADLLPEGVYRAAELRHLHDLFRHGVALARGRSILEQRAGAIPSTASSAPTATCSARRRCGFSPSSSYPTPHADA